MAPVKLFRQKCLCVLPAGENGKQYTRKLVERFGHDSFDHLIVVYDDSRFDEDCFARCTVLYQKSPLFWSLKQSVTPELCRRYEYVFIWMDDLDVLDFNPQNFLRILRSHRIEVAQPALSPDSIICHPITARREGSLGRYTDFVEQMAIVFRGDLWERFWRLISPDHNPWGWGCDEFAYSACRFRRMAIIDAEVVRHLRRGSYHASGFVERTKFHQQHRRSYFSRKRTLCSISDGFLHKHVTIPLRLNLYFLFAWLHTIPGLAHLRPLLSVHLRRATLRMFRRVFPTNRS